MEFRRYDGNDLVLLKGRLYLLDCDPIGPECIHPNTRAFRVEYGIRLKVALPGKAGQALFQASYEIWNGHIKEKVAANFKLL